MKKVLLSLVSVFAATNLSAASHVSKNIQVPFEFKVDKMTLPAGEYRLEHEFGGYMVTIVNVQTGCCVRVLRDPSYRSPDRARLIFEPTGQGYKLTRVS